MAQQMWEGIPSSSSDESDGVNRGDASSREVDDEEDGDDNPRRQLNPEFQSAMGSMFLIASQQSPAVMSSLELEAWWRNGSVYRENSESADHGDASSGEVDDEDADDVVLRAGRSTGKKGRPIEYKDDPAKMKTNKRNRERYKQRQLRKQHIPPDGAGVLNCKPRSAERRRQRSEQKVVGEARDAFIHGDMVEGSRLQATTMGTHAGRSMFPFMADKLAQTSAHHAAGEAICDVLRNGAVAGSQKQAMVRCLTADMGKSMRSDFCAATNIAPKTMQSAHWLSRTTNNFSLSSNPLSWKRSSRTSKTPDAVPGIEKVVVDFFCDHAPVRSGAKTETREMGLSLTELRITFFEEYPRLLRKLNNHSPLLLKAATTKLAAGTNLTRFESSLMAAVQQAKDATFNQDKDEAQRRHKAEVLAKFHLEKKRLGSNRMHILYSVPEFERDHQATQEILHANETDSVIQLTLDYDIENLQTDDADDEDSNVKEDGNDEDRDSKVRKEDGNDEASESKVPRMYPPSSERVFFRILKKYKIHWTSNIKKTECPIHDEGPLIGLQRTALAAKLMEVGTQLSDVRRSLQASNKDKLNSDESTVALLRKSEVELQKAFRDGEATLRTLKDKETLYRNHLKQYEACRKTIKQIESNLVPGEAVLYRDFVAAYNCEGTKLQNLVLVVLWRETIGAPLQVWKFSNLCDDPQSRSADAYYVADVFEFYFGVQRGQEHSCSFFRDMGIKKIYVSGDHGPHFSSIATMFNESTMKEKYGLEIVLFFLCSYHCYNRCDGAGVEPKKLAKSSAKDRISVRSAAEVASVLNSSRYFNSWAFDFPTINRNEDRFPLLVEDASLNLRKMCQVQYSFVDERGQQASEAGVILCRLTPAAPGATGELFEVYDLLAQPAGGPLCRACSKFVQRPVRHGETQCPHLHTKNDEYSDSVKKTLNKSVPDPKRIQGPQHNKTWRTNGNKPQGSFPCRVDDVNGTMCMTGHHYNTALNANKHMIKEHNLEANSPSLYPTVFACTETGCTRTYASEAKRNDHVTGHSAKPTSTLTSKRKSKDNEVEECVVPPAPAAASAAAGTDIPMQTSTSPGIALPRGVGLIPAPAGALATITYEAQRAARIAENNAKMASLNLSGCKDDLFATAKGQLKRKRRSKQEWDSDSTDSEDERREHSPKTFTYNTRISNRTSAKTVASAKPEVSASEPEDSDNEEVKKGPLEKTINFCVVFGENNEDEPEVWFAVETEGEEEDDGHHGDRPIRWLEQNAKGTWLTKMATCDVGQDFIYATKRVTLRRSEGEGDLVYELKPEDVPTSLEMAEYQLKLKKQCEAPVMPPQRSSSTKASTTTVKSSLAERGGKEWKDVEEWKLMVGSSDQYHFTLKASECKVNRFFLMSCIPKDTKDEDDKKRFLFVGKVKSVSTENQTFTYTTYSAREPANAYDSSCVDGKWVALTHTVDADSTKHSDVFMYFDKLLSMSTLPAFTKNRIRMMCPFLYDTHN